MTVLRIVVGDQLTRPLASLTDLDPARDADELPGDVRRVRRQQKQERVCDVVGLADATGWNERR